MALVEFFSETLNDHIFDQAIRSSSTGDFNRGVYYQGERIYINIAEFREVFHQQRSIAGAISADATTIHALGNETAFDDFLSYEMTLTGTFTYGPLNTVAGQLNAFSTSVDGEVVYRITGLDADISRAWPALQSTSHRDELRELLSGDDTFIGSNGFDDVRANPGDDFIDGNGGIDSLNGGRGHDTIFGGADNDSLYGESGRDRLHGDFGDDYLSAGNGRDTLIGGAGDDRLFGGGGRDLYNGGEGNDVFLLDDRQKLSRGETTIIPSADVLVFRTGDGQDTVHGFDTDMDVIKIARGASQLSDITIADHPTDHRSSTVSFVDVTITLIGVDADDLTLSNFLF
ncbi:MAG: hypothetical protein N4A53_15315 [Pelagimonas sp.]|jgi:Ca2+-binding RTX toxin-like protein|nr:hypothetical protein [Pelagimonas sp.]